MPLSLLLLGLDSGDWRGSRPFLRNLTQEFQIINVVGWSGWRGLNRQKLVFLRRIFHLIFFLNNERSYKLNTKRILRLECWTNQTETVVNMDDSGRAPLKRDKITKKKKKVLRHVITSFFLKKEERGKGMKI